MVSLLLLLLSSAVGFAGEDAGENASNPLAKVKNTDLRWQYTDSDDSHVNNMFVDGAFMANDS